MQGVVGQPADVYGNVSTLSLVYIAITTPTCFKLEVHRIRKAFCFALANAGSSIAARMAMIAMTTSNSIRVKARRFLRRELFWKKMDFMFFFNVLETISFFASTRNRKSNWLHILIVSRDGTKIPEYG